MTKDLEVIGKQVGPRFNLHYPTNIIQESCRQKNASADGAISTERLRHQQRVIVPYPITPSLQKLVYFQKKLVSLSMIHGSRLLISDILFSVVFRGGPDKYEVWSEMKGMLHLQYPAFACNKEMQCYLLYPFVLSNGQSSTAQGRSILLSKKKNS
jgi:hypothetical protein